MAFYRGPQSPREEQYTNSFSPPQPRNPNRWSANMAAPADVRGSLHRRFTTTTVPTMNGISGLSPIGQQRLQAAGETQPTIGLHHRYETLLQQQRQIQEELDRIDPETRREVDENLRHEQDVNQLIAQSEPTTPPEYHNAFSGFSRSSRYSTASLASPPGLATRPNRASTQLTSPSLSFVRTYMNGGGVGGNPSNIPSQSVPGSRRHSDDEDDGDYRFQFEQRNDRSAAKSNRNSMPVSSFDRTKRNTTDLSLGHINTTGFLFGDDGEQIPHLPQTNPKASPSDTKTYLKVQHTADGFPKLIRSEQTFEPALSISSALDLASSAKADQQQTTRGPRQRMSLPPATMSNGLNLAPLNSILAGNNDNRQPALDRRSMEVKFPSDNGRPALMSVAPRAYTNGATSSSTNDLPTLKSINGANGHSDSAISLSSPSAQSSKALEPMSPERAAASGLLTPRYHQDFSAGVRLEDNQDGLGRSMLQGSAVPFFTPAAENVSPRPFGGPVAAYGQPYFNPYGMQMLSNGFGAMNIGMGAGFGIPQQFPLVGNPYPQPIYAGFQAYPPVVPVPTTATAAARITSPQRRATTEEAQQSFNSIKLEQIVGQIYTLCKDQHGCRFLQRKLDERNEQTVQIIFEDVKTHMVELMVDPFGNYLCQKLFESCNDDQRTVLVKNAMPAMTKIALNQHGTRALQKMIEFVSKPEQTALIIEALRDDVVALIQDLNGNHVIQKCLNHLSPTDARFIFEAVGNNCVAVGTHRHGCCVLQRCIDHADGLQKGEMVNHVIKNADQLVKDPFGNYVVQYILDLAEPCFTEPLSRAFLTNIVYLSKQKFSSNVIEKCIRCAGPDTKRDIIREIMLPQALDKLLRDSYANYVVQTAMDFADEETKPVLIKNIRDVLPTIRNTPHGRRVQSKVADYDARMASSGTTILAALESKTAAPAVTSNQTPSRANRYGMVGAPQQWPAKDYNYVSYGNNGAANAGEQINGHAEHDMIAPTPQRGNPNFMLNDGQDYNASNGYVAQPFDIANPQIYSHF